MEFSTRTTLKGEAAYKADAVTPDGNRPHEVFWVRSTTPGSGHHYRVEIAADRSWAWCGCRANRGRSWDEPRCYHVAAALFALKETIEASA